MKALLSDAVKALISAPLLLLFTDCGSAELVSETGLFENSWQLRLPDCPMITEPEGIHSLSTAGGCELTGARVHAPSIKVITHSAEETVLLVSHYEQDIDVTQATHSRLFGSTLQVLPLEKRHGQTALASPVLGVYTHNEVMLLLNEEGDASSWRWIRIKAPLPPVLESDSRYYFLDQGEILQVRRCGLDLITQPLTHQDLPEADGLLITSHETSLVMLDWQAEPVDSDRDNSGKQASGVTRGSEEAEGGDFQTVQSRRTRKKQGKGSLGGGGRPPHESRSSELPSQCQASALPDISAVPMKALPQRLINAKSIAEANEIIRTGIKLYEDSQKGPRGNRMSNKRLSDLRDALDIKRWANRIDQTLWAQLKSHTSNLY